MAVRLLGWLARPRAGEVGSFAEAAQRYRDEGGFVDRARYSLDSGDSIPILAQAYARLAEMATTRRQAENKHFAELLANWTEAGSVSDAVLCVEQVLGEVVARAAKDGPVLLIVIDGSAVAATGDFGATFRHRGIADEPVLRKDSHRHKQR
jgi:hypothetical protein